MCEYCEKRKKLIEMKSRGRVVDGNVGIEVDIFDNILEIEAIGEVGYPSRDYICLDDSIIINYCPMCGRKL